MDHPRAGMHYPRSVGEFQAWFSTEAACLDYLEWLRWPKGFVCLHCGQGDSWRLGDGRFMCTVCGHRTSVTAGTIFDRTRTPLSVWFTACWLFATAKDGTSALGLQRALEIGSYLKGTGSTGGSDLTRRLEPCLHRGSTTRRPATGR